MSLPQMVLPPQWARQCGRPTKSKTACKQRADGYLPACKLHSTPDELALNEVLVTVERAGYKNGRDSAKGASELELKHLKDKVKKLEQQEDDRDRIFSVGGDQLVEVEGYAYRWSGPKPLVVGDRVRLPANYISPRGWSGLVTKLGSRWKGEHARILGGDTSSE